MAVLTLNLQNLRTQTNRRFPERDKASDGWIGDKAHQKRKSGHNPDDTAGSIPTWDGDADSLAEVRSWDCDKDLRDSTVSAQEFVDHIRALPDVGSVIRFIIYNRKIYEAHTGFAPTTYTGDNPHTEHVHFEGQRTQAADNNRTFDFQLEDLGMPTADEIAKAVWDYKLANGSTTGGALATESARSNELRTVFLPRMEATLALVPTAQRNAEAVVQAIGGIALGDLALVLRGVLGPERTAELKGLL